MSDLDALYQSIILDHNRRPRNHGALADADRREDARNPLCGDTVTVYLKLDGDRLADVRCVSQGCAISRASASLMTVALAGKCVAEADAIVARVHAMVTGRGDAEGLGPLAALAGVARFPMRVKCASMAWHAVRGALHPAPPAAG